MLWNVNVPVVLTREEVSRVIAVLEGVPRLIVKFLYEFSPDQELPIKCSRTIWSSAA